MEISRLINAFGNTTTEAVGLRLVVALKKSKGFSGLRADLLKAKLEKFPEPVQEQGKALLTELNVDWEKQKAHLDELLASMPAIRQGVPSAFPNRHLTPSATPCLVPGPVRGIFRVWLSTSQPAARRILSTF